MLLRRHVACYSSVRHVAAKRRTPSRTHTHAAATPERDNNSTTGASNAPANQQDDIAAGFKPPPGELTLWWVEKYEARRKRLEEEKAKLQAPASTSTGTQHQPATPSAAAEAAAPAGESAPAAAAAAAGTSQVNTEKLPWHTALMANMRWVLQILQLVLVLAGLILYPAFTQPGGLYYGRIWLLYLAYLLFFASSVQRVAKHGSLSPRSADKQTSSWLGRLGLVAYIVCIVLLHWAPAARFVALELQYAAVTWYEALGIPCMMAAWWLNRRAAADLGQAWDRVVAPTQLVTTGIYKHIQHPIYTSYMMLFFGYACVLHSAPTAIMLMAVCALYYRRRTQLEAEVLHDAFGQQYDEYAERTRKFIPLLL